MRRRTVELVKGAAARVHDQAVFLFCRQRLLHVHTVLSDLLMCDLLMRLAQSSAGPKTFAPSVCA